MCLIKKNMKIILIFILGLTKLIKYNTITMDLITMLDDLDSLVD